MMKKWRTGGLVMYEKLSVKDLWKYCHVWPDDNPYDVHKLVAEAAEAIEKLEAKNKELESKMHDSFTEHLLNQISRKEKQIDKLKVEKSKLEKELELVKAEMGEAVRDMEAIMWVSGEGCQICKHCIEIHKEPYVQYACKIESRGCDPKWRGVQGGKDD